MKQTTTKQQYEAALETIHLYEKRQEQLNYVKKQLAKKLKQFKQVKFKVNKKKGEIIFSGLHAKTNKLLLSKSVCAYNDQFDVNIGKLIVVKKALGEDIESIVELVEKSNLVNCLGTGVITGLREASFNHWSAKSNNVN